MCIMFIIFISKKKKKIENICYKVDILTSKRPLLLIDIADFLATEIIY